MDGWSIFVSSWLALTILASGAMADDPCDPGTSTLQGNPCVGAGAPIPVLSAPGCPDTFNASEHPLDGIGHDVVTWAMVLPAYDDQSTFESGTGAIPDSSSGTHSHSDATYYDEQCNVRQSEIRHEDKYGVQLEADSRGHYVCHWSHDELFDGQTTRTEESYDGTAHLNVMYHDLVPLAVDAGATTCDSGNANGQFQWNGDGRITALGQDATSDATPYCLEINNILNGDELRCYLPATVVIGGSFTLVHPHS